MKQSTLSLLSYPVILLLITLASGCIGKNTQIHQYTLEDRVLAPMAAPPVFTDNRMILIGPVILPGQYVGSSIVTRSGTAVIKSSTIHLWAAPLDEQIAALISNQLATLLQSNNVAVYPGPRFADRSLQVELTMDRFSGSPGEDFTCSLTWTINDLQTRKIVRRERFTLTVPVTGNSYQEYVAAASVLLARFSSKVLAPALADLAPAR
jgi:uncharacterized lipoprotein YmbA